MANQTIIPHINCPFCRALLMAPKTVPSVEHPGFFIVTYGAMGGSSQVEVTITREDPNKLADRFIYGRFVHNCPGVVVK